MISWKALSGNSHRGSALSNLRRKTSKLIGGEEGNSKVSDRSQPLLEPDSSLGQNGWLRFAAPSCSLWI
jgi:hypothetical protein